MSRKEVSPELFVIVWQKSASLADASRRLGMPKGVAAARACRYRKLGVKLKMMERVTA